MHDGCGPRTRWSPNKVYHGILWVNTTRTLAWGLLFGDKSNYTSQTTRARSLMRGIFAPPKQPKTPPSRPVQCKRRMDADCLIMRPRPRMWSWNDGEKGIWVRQTRTFNYLMAFRLISKWTMDFRNDYYMCGHCKLDIESSARRLKEA